jgi:hypothetical protein
MAERIDWITLYQLHNTVLIANPMKTIIIICLRNLFDDNLPPN